MEGYFGYGQLDKVSPLPVSNSFSSSSGRQRHFYTETQLELLDAEFAAEQFPSRERRRRIAQQLNVTEKSVLWWFQNRRRRVRQQTKTLNSGASKLRVGRYRQHRRSSPYVTSQPQLQQDSGDNWTSVSTNWPVWPSSYPFSATNDPQTPEEPTSCPSTKSTSPSYQQASSPSHVGDQTFQPHWISPSYCVNQNVVEMQQLPNQFYNYHPPEFQADEQQNFYWNNWECSPPFYPSAMPSNRSITSNSQHYPVESSDYGSLYY